MRRQLLTGSATSQRRRMTNSGMTLDNSRAEPGNSTVAAAIARFVAGQGVERVYTLPGSHVKPICSELARRGIRIVSTRHECAAVHMAHAEADLTGRIGVALVTTGPGLTNAVTGIASAYLSRTPLLVMSARDRKSTRLNSSHRL